MKHFTIAVAWILVCALYAQTSLAKEYHVAINGNDAGDGSADKPLKTISAAANLAKPGDTVTVHAGTYRERIDPPRGGTSDGQRITYQAAAGEKVTITGSEAAKGWVKVSGDTWKIVIPSKSFGNFNPYVDRIRGDWFGANGRVHHTGCVYLNGHWMVEAKNLNEVMKPARSTQNPLWFATVDGDKGEPLVNIAWLKAGNGAKISAGEPSWRYGGKPAPCSEGGNCSGWIMNGDQLRFDGVDFGSGTDSVELRTAAPAGAGALIELRLNTLDGELLGTCMAGASGDWQKWQTFTAKIKPTSGKKSLCLVFKNPAVDAGNTTIFAQFPGVNPNEASAEINQRQTVFYPSRNFINYITVRGFTLQNAATQWAPPSAEQTAVVGTNWSKGWIIENNTIRYSKCCGVSLGKYGDGTDNTNDAGAADPYTACVRRALKNGWNKQTIGGHVVRNNHISYCEQTGIVGSMGCAFSTVSGNEIHEIHIRNLFGGAEMAGIKFHGAIDVVISDNHIYRCGSIGGLWLDWMAQGAVVAGNLMHDNHQDFFGEMQHGPMLFANNIFLSNRLAFSLNSQGIAFAHNLIAGPTSSHRGDNRVTPFQAAHATDIAGLFPAAKGDSGDHRFYNNLVVAPGNFNAINKVALTSWAEGNVFTKGCHPSKFDKQPLVNPGFNPALKLTQEKDGWYLQISLDPGWAKGQARKLVTSELLGKAKVPGCAFENADGTAIKVDIDYFHTARNQANPFPGPLEMPNVGGAQRVKVWPK